MREPFFRCDGAVLYHGDCIEVMAEMDEASIDAVVCDPPAGIAFFAQEWDDFRREPGAGDDASESEYGRSERGNFVSWLTAVMRECRRVLKPGGHAVVWALPRTSHWTAWAMEDAGLEIRDVIDHIFAMGFPKSLNVPRAILQVGERDGRDLVDEAERWQGWGTGLKPAKEHWILARKPLIGSVAANVLAYGTGALNIDACRVVNTGPEVRVPQSDPAMRKGVVGMAIFGCADKERFQQIQRESVERTNSLGRWPANVILAHAEGCRKVGQRQVAAPQAGWRPGAIFGGIAQREGRGRWFGGHGQDGVESVDAYECVDGCPVAELNRQSGVRGTAVRGPDDDVTYGESGVVSRFFKTIERTIADDPGLFYCPKAPPAERHGGMSRREGERNFHPTVKPIALMQYLVRLVTPPDGVVLDCFAGSGSTLIAARERPGVLAIGIERERKYVELAARRLAGTDVQLSWL